ncbi:MAG: photosystem II reaction center protein Psb28 [Symploca sp. SIO3C6]|uniref:Photosystem II reaction center Psb28 protein n=1 Tax=Symploca sp. SIO1C4 TaxID=2607765 RepID=A0A6B3NAD4_9CYAN|nr:photosystem II reaction center protein Psb28 [Symploca sp. SIO3C6]NER26148.1 photosystem II reaction center protein Psb28 [Symploca sp. SIO1C4]NET03767.1 photosystem II reaction center protein Psb28 [Symploca sp. SIO2B6]NET53642.1 photosystem II reaction center protein Psb28 [Merismopedia sp. SIO2A8]
MNSQAPSIQFFEGIYEELSNVSLRHSPSRGVRIVLMTFDELQALEKFNSFTKKSTNSMLLTDEEGEIRIEPSSVKILFGGSEGNELQRVECALEFDIEERWERFMRFMHRYAEANGMGYKQTEKNTGSSTQ